MALNRQADPAGNRNSQYKWFMIKFFPVIVVGEWQGEMNKLTSM